MGYIGIMKALVYLALLSRVVILILTELSSMIKIVILLPIFIIFYSIHYIRNG